MSGFEGLCGIMGGENGMMSNETKVAQLVLAHHAFVKALAFKLAPWPGLVDDISQQVFLEFLAKQEKWDLEQDLRPLLATMTRLVAARYWRERKRAMPEVMRELADYVRGLAEEREAPAYTDEKKAAHCWSFTTMRVFPQWTSPGKWKCTPMPSARRSAACAASCANVFTGRF